MRALRSWRHSSLDWQQAFLPDGTGNRYETIRRNLMPGQILDAIGKVSDSDRFDIGDLSHITLKGTDVTVGYIGNETLELFCPKGTELALYRIPHRHLRRLFNSI